MRFLIALVLTFAGCGSHSSDTAPGAGMNLGDEIECNESPVVLDLNQGMGIPLITLCAYQTDGSVFECVPVNGWSARDGVIELDSWCQSFGGDMRASLFVRWL